MRSTPALRLMTVLSMLAVPSGSVFAQRYWHDDAGRDAVRLDVWYPFLKGDADRFFTGAFVPSVSYRVGDGFRVEGDLPVMRSGYRPPDGTTRSNLRIGNPYLGLRIGDDAKLVTGTIGVRAALEQTPSSLQGALAVSAAAASDFDDFEAFVPALLTFRGGGELEVRRD